VTDAIDDRLAKILEEFNRMLGKPEKDEDALSKLIRLGLTPNEAKTWLENEPNFIPSDEFLQRKKSDGDFTLPDSTRSNSTR
jgi:hypothetical protein